ncbi:MAG: ABC transporter substrate-binding protein, partial [Chloroflexota bacterium]
HVIIACLFTGMNAAPLIISVEKGYFKDQNLDVETVATNGGSDGIVQVGSGQIDAFLGTVSAATFAAVDRGVSLKLVASSSRYALKGEPLSMTAVVRKPAYDSGQIKSFKDLKGKTVSFNSPGSGTEYLFQKGLEKNGLSLSDMNVTYVGTPPDTLTALKNGSIDVTPLPSPLDKQAIQQGLGVQLGADEDSDPNPGQQFIFMICSPKFLAERRDVAIRFLAGYEKGLRDVANGGSHEANNVQILAKAFKYDPSYVLQSVNYFDTRMTVNASDIQDEEKLWIDRGSLKITKPVPAEQLVDNSLVEPVLQKLGPAPSAAASAKA